jgi:hypothetical protein
MADIDFINKKFIQQGIPSPVESLKYTVNKLAKLKSSK